MSIAINGIIRMYEFRVRFIAGPQKGEYLSTTFITDEKDEGEADYLARFAAHQWMLNLWRSEVDFIHDECQVTATPDFITLDPDDKIRKGGYAQRLVRGGATPYAYPVDYRIENGGN